MLDESETAPKLHKPLRKGDFCGGFVCCYKIQKVAARAINGTTAPQMVKIATFCRKTMRRSSGVSKSHQAPGVTRSLRKRLPNQALPTISATIPIASPVSFGEKLGCRCPKVGVHLRLVITTDENTAKQGAKTVMSVTSNSALEYDAASDALLSLRARASLRRK